MYAIVKAGGHQEKVEVGDVILVNRLDAKKGDTVTITRYSGVSTSLDIPSEIDGKTVTAINLADILANDYKQRVVLVDCDGQANLTGFFLPGEDMDAVTTADVLTGDWQDGLNALLDTYFGVRPEKFTYEGKEYTPESFAASLPIKMDDYVDVGSFTHHPFYTEFIIEVPDNWMWGTVYNVPLEEMMAVVDNALANGYSIEWATDVSEKGFDRIKAIGIIPETDIDGMEGTEAEKWGKLSAAEKEAALYKFDKPVKEKKITQEMRQIAFDNYETTDDHGMVIVGTAVDQQGNPFFKVKNSWDVRPPYDGYYYFSRPFVEYKTLSVMVNKNAIPQEIRTKLGI